MKEKDFSELVETYMKLDKRTLAEMLAVKELYSNKGNNYQKPCYIPVELPPAKTVYPFYLSEFSTISGKLEDTFLC